MKGNYNINGNDKNNDSDGNISNDKKNNKQ